MPEQVLSRSVIIDHTSYPPTAGMSPNWCLCLLQKMYLWLDGHCTFDIFIFLLYQSTFLIYIHYSFNMGRNPSLYLIPYKVLYPLYLIPLYTFFGL